MRQCWDYVALQGRMTGNVATLVECEFAVDQKSHWDRTREAGATRPSYGMVQHHYKVWQKHRVLLWIGVHWAWWARILRRDFERILLTPRPQKDVLRIPSACPSGCYASLTSPSSSSHPFRKNVCSRVIVLLNVSARIFMHRAEKTTQLHPLSQN
jgi:hypothetical protein